MEVVEDVNVGETESSTLISGNPSQNEVTKIDDNAINNLSKGFMEVYVNDLTSLGNPLDELQRNQEVLIESVERENARLSDVLGILNLQEMFRNIAHYQAKLVSIKKDMVSLHEKSQKLKTRALKLKTIKEKETGVTDVKLEPKRN